MSHYKQYPAYKDSGVEWIGCVPEHWEVKPVYSVASLRNGFPFKSELFRKEGLRHNRILGIRDITGDDEAIYSEEISPGWAVIKEGDILIGMDGDFNVHRWERGTAKLNQRMCAVNGVSDGISCLLNHSLAIPLKVINDLAYATTVKHLSSYEVLHIHIPVPPKDELDCINQRLTSETTRIDTLISKKTRFIELLKEKRQALITHAVTKGLDPNVKMKDSGVKWIGEVPEHWDVVQLRHVAKLGSGHTPSRSRPDWWENGYIPWFTLADIWQVRREGRRYIFDTEETVSDLGIANSSATVHPSGSVVLSRTASVGFPAIMGCDMATSQDFAVWRCGKRVHNEYLYMVLLGMKQELSRLMIGSTHKTIYMPDIEAFRMPLPSVHEQKALVGHVDSELQRIDRLSEKTQRSIDLIKERRSAFITAAVTGQIDLRENV